jgi:hypothetical protein
MYIYLRLRKCFLHFLNFLTIIKYVDNKIQPVSCNKIFFANTMVLATSTFSLFSHATKALSEGRGIALLCFQTTALEGGE